MLPLFDTHMHLIYREQASYSWTQEVPLLAKDPFTLENYKIVTEGLGIEGALFMETGVDDGDYQKETHFVHSLIKKNKNGIKGMIVSIRPEKEHLFDRWLHETK